MISTTFIILNWNTPKLTINCVKSIYRHISIKNFQVVVVDNGSTDNSVSSFKKLKYKNFHLVKNSSNLGFAKGNNSANKYFTTKYLVFLNSDTEFVDNSINHAISFLAKNPQSGIIAPKLLLTNGQIQASVYPPQSIKNAIKEYWFGVKNAFSPFYPTSHKPTAVDTVAGAALIIPTKLFKKIGGWNEKYFLYFEDFDLCRKVRQLNKKIIFHPSWIIRHHHGQSGKKLASSKHQWRRLVDGSKKYHGFFKHYLLGLIIKLGTKQSIYKFAPCLFLCFLTITFFYKSVFKQLVPFPGDMLVGSYYPWLDYKWGNIVGVPVKNPIISDVFSQIYLWKQQIVKSFLEFRWPLWNPYTYAGYPLLANFQSAALNPANIFFIVFGMINGWTINVISQILLCLLTSYLFLRQLKISKLGSLLGSITYAFSGFSIVWLQYLTVGFAMAWIPLALYYIDKYFGQKNIKYLIPLPILIFLLSTCGHFQSLFYGLFIFVFYSVYKFLSASKKNMYALVLFFLSIFIGMAMSSIQIIPTYELLSHSIRNQDQNIRSQNFGLIPITNLITFFAPDFFGNPTTYNYWGVHNYNETVVYLGIIAYLSLIFFTFFSKKSKAIKFFYVTSVASIIFITDNPIAKIPYNLRLPFISTSYANRLVVILTLSMSVLTGFFVDNFSKHRSKTLLTFIIAALIPIILYFQIIDKDLVVAHRNIILPTIIFFFISLIAIISIWKKYFTIILLPIIVFELFRFGWKYTPFVPKEYIYPATPITDFLAEKQDIFRVEKETGPLMPSNTWMAYSLSVLSGYDPLALKSYVDYYNSTINNSSAPASRYSTLDYYDAKKLGQNNVRYLLSLKYNQIMEIKPEGQVINSKINQSDWNLVFTSGSVNIFENKYYQPRAQLYQVNTNNHTGNLEIINYQDNNIDIKYQSDVDVRLELNDTWMPGWYVIMENQTIPIHQAKDSIFRHINLPRGNHQIKILYQPKSFLIGKDISIIFTLMYIPMSFYILKTNRHEKY